jgi:lipid II:glycine glycyltransferase (peptidoglycan interpeptide bridge formation enzyme)
MSLEVLGPSDSKLWDEIAYASGNGTLYHTWNWLKIVETNFSGKLFPLVFFDKDKRPFAAIPLFLAEKYGLKMVFSPPPGTSITLGPILLDKGYKQSKFESFYLDFQRNLEDFIRALHANYINIITSPGLLDIRPFSWDKYRVIPSYTYKIDLQPGEKEIWGNVSSSLRNAINKTRSLGVEVIEANIDQNSIVDYVFNSLCERYRDQGLNNSLKKKYLQNIVSKFGGSQIQIFFAKYQERIVGAQITSNFKDTVTGWVGATRAESNDLEINGIIFWEIIIRSIKEGFKWLENMGANTPRLCPYKSKFCPSVAIYFEIKKHDLLGFLAEKAYFQFKKKFF